MKNKDSYLHKPEVDFSKIIDPGEYELVIRKKEPVFNYEPWQVEEIRKCRDDVAYFAEKYVKICSIDHSSVSLKLYDWQKIELLNWKYNRFNNTRCSRQIGATTLQLIYCLHAAMFNDRFKIAFLVNKEKMATELINRLKAIISHLPNWLYPGVDSIGKSMISFVNESHIFLRCSSVDALRGYAANIVMIDNVDWSKMLYKSELINCIFPSITTSPKGQLIFCGTPKVGDINSLQRKLKSNGRFKTSEYLWYMHPDRNLSWKNTMIEMIGKKNWAEEYELKRYKQ